jgi:hypothetical protein
MPVVYEGDGAARDAPPAVPSTDDRAPTRDAALNVERPATI